MFNSLEVSGRNILKFKCFRSFLNHLLLFSISHSHAVMAQCQKCFKISLAHESWREKGALEMSRHCRVKVECLHFLFIMMSIIIVWFLCWTMKLNLIESTNWMHNDCCMNATNGRGENLKRIESEFNFPSACDSWRNLSLVGV